MCGYMEVDMHGELGLTAPTVIFTSGNEAFLKIVKCYCVRIEVEAAGWVSLDARGGNIER